MSKKTSVGFVLRDYNDKSEFKRFEALDEAEKYIKENYLSSCDISNIKDTLKAASLERDGAFPLTVSTSISIENVDLLVKKYNLEPVDDLDDGAVRFARLYMGMPYLYTTTYNNKFTTYGVRETVKEALKLFLEKQQAYVIRDCQDGGYWFKVCGKLISSDTPSWFKFIQKEYNFFDESFLVPYEG